MFTLYFNESKYNLCPKKSLKSFYTFLRPGNNISFTTFLCFSLRISYYITKTFLPTKFFSLKCFKFKHGHTNLTSLRVIV